MTDTTLIIGATSSLAASLCHQLAKAGHDLVLLARDEAELATLKDDLTTRYKIDCDTAVVDFAADPFDASCLDPYLEQIDSAYMLAGSMGNGDALDADNTAQVIRTTFNAPAILLTRIASAMKARGQGALVVVSSVAGDRGRGSNFTYGSAKAGLSAFADGLRHFLHGSGVHVMTVKPGFIDTPMTFGMESPLMASREKVAKQIIRANKSGTHTLYTPGIWRYIMLLICHIPEWLFLRTKL
jgi:decaprenylphospho-beta-D-erythro-pentofuranosid-2-ulose 2-reductase